MQLINYTLALPTALIVVTTITYTIYIHILQLTAALRRQLNPSFQLINEGSENAARGIFEVDSRDLLAPGCSLEVRQSHQTIKSRSSSQPSRHPTYLKMATVSSIHQLARVTDRRCYRLSPPIPIRRLYVPRYHELIFPFSDSEAQLSSLTGPRSPAPSVSVARLLPPCRPSRSATRTSAARSSSSRSSPPPSTSPSTDPSSRTRPSSTRSRSDSTPSSPLPTMSADS